MLKKKQLKIIFLSQIESFFYLFYMGKKILNGDQIKEGLIVKLVKRFSDMEEGSIGKIVDFENTELGEITEIVIDWKNGSTVPYFVSQDIPEKNIINYLEEEN